jgi:hypothetical protein
MTEIQFTDRSHELTIAGHVFRVSPGDVEALSAGTSLAERLKSLDLATIGEDPYRQLAAEIMETIDGVLGEGACALIFTGRRINILDLVELLTHVLKAAIGDFRTAVGGMLVDLTETVSED